MFLAGTPTRTEFAGKLFVTTAFAPILQLSPIVTPPIILAPAPISTFFPIVGQLLSLSEPLFPIVTCCLNTTPSPKTTSLLITIPYGWYNLISSLINSEAYNSVPKTPTTNNAFKTLYIL